MGSSKNRFREFAVAFWKTAKYDLDRAEDSFKEKAYSYAVFHSQQCTEKIVKAVLEKDGKVVSPVESYEKKDAKEALEKRGYTFYILTKFLKERYKVEVKQ